MSLQTFFRSIETITDMPKELVIYSRSTGCPTIALVKRALKEHALPYRELFIDLDEQARERVRDWTGFLSVPTLIVAIPGEDMPCETPAPLEKGLSPRGLNRGAMISEPNVFQLLDWRG